MWFKLGTCFLLSFLMSVVCCQENGTLRQPRCSHPSHRHRLQSRRRSTTTPAPQEVDHEDRDDGDIYESYAEYFRSKERLIAKLRDRRLRRRRRPVNKRRETDRGTTQDLGFKNSSVVYLTKPPIAILLFKSAPKGSPCYGVDCGSGKTCFPSQRSCIAAATGDNSTDSNSTCLPYECVRVFIMHEVTVLK